MRTRDEIETHLTEVDFSLSGDVPSAQNAIIIEILLDIRELLINNEDAVAQVKQAIYDRRLQ